MQEGRAFPDIYGRRFRQVKRITLPSGTPSSYGVERAERGMLARLHGYLVLARIKGCYFSSTVFLTASPMWSTISKTLVAGVGLESAPASRFALDATSPALTGS